MKYQLLWMLLCVFSVITSHAQIDLVTVPERRAVELTIYNSADLTMVRDRRLLTFKKGTNVLQFTWSGTLIDPSSIELYFRTQKDQLSLIDTVFPPQRNDALQWNVTSEFDGDAEVEITYFTSGISWQSTYMAHLTNDDTKMELQGDVKVINNSGENYPNAKVSLIVGTVNLVEEIATLARNRGGWGNVEPDVRKHVYLELERAREEAEEALDDADMVEAPAISKPKGIVKKGLSEYFIFTIEGTETIPNGWSKSLNSVAVKDIPIEVTFRLNDNWSKFHRFLRFDNNNINDKKDKTNLGQSPLPNGTVHIFRRDSKSNLSFLAHLNLPYIAINDKCELDTGEQEEVVIERVVHDYKRKNIRFDTNNNLEAWDEIFVYQVEIENTLTFKSLLEIQRSFANQAIVSGLPYKEDQINNTTFKYYPELAGATKNKFSYTVQVHHGK